MRVDWCVSSWFRIKNTHSLTHEVTHTWTTKNWHGLQMQRLSVVLHTAVAWQTDGERAS